MKLNDLESTVKFPSLLSAISSWSACNGESTRVGKIIRNSAITLPGLLKRTTNVLIVQRTQSILAKIVISTVYVAKDRTVNLVLLRQHFAHYVCTHF